ncbi:hypothetical protein HAX54_017004, partial [Datura stramonium]|nr:hypothetical protein [Datura stramonium]
CMGHEGGDVLVKPSDGPSLALSKLGYFILKVMEGTMDRQMCDGQSLRSSLRLDL